MSIKKRKENEWILNMIVIKLKKSHLILLLVFIVIATYLGYTTCQNKIKYKIFATEILKDAQQYYLFNSKSKYRKDVLKMTTSGNIRVLNSSKNKNIKNEMNMQLYCLFITSTTTYKKDFNKSIIKKINNLCKLPTTKTLSLSRN